MKDFYLCTAGEIKHHRDTHLLTFVATVARPSVVHKGRIIYSDLSSPSEGMLKENINKFISDNDKSFVARPIEVSIQIPSGLSWEYN